MADAENDCPTIALNDQGASTSAPLNSAHSRLAQHRVVDDCNSPAAVLLKRTHLARTPASAHRTRKVLVEKNGATATESAVAAANTPSRLSNIASIREECSCSICLELATRPVTLPCGHNFCRSCLRQAVKAAKRCPQCRAPVREVPRSVNAALWNLIQLLFPRDTADAPPPTPATPIATALEPAEAGRPMGRAFRRVRGPSRLMTVSFDPPAPMFPELERIPVTDIAEEPQLLLPRPQRPAVASLNGAVAAPERALARPRRQATHASIVPREMLAQLANQQEQSPSQGLSQGPTWAPRRPHRPHRPRRGTERAIDTAASADGTAENPIDLISPRHGAFGEGSFGAGSQAVAGDGAIQFAGPDSGVSQLDELLAALSVGHDEQATTRVNSQAGPARSFGVPRRLRGNGVSGVEDGGLGAQQGVANPFARRPRPRVAGLRRAVARD